jgi:hypothetical protein
MNTTTSRIRRMGTAAAVAGILGLSGGAGVAASAAEQPACDQGDATRVLQAGIQGFAKALAGHSERGIVYSLANCQVQLSLDGAHYTFSDDDVFALQQTFFGPWQCFFSTPQESVADFAIIEERAFIAPVVDGVVGQETEVELSMTPVKTVAFTTPLDVPGWEGCFDQPATAVHYQTVGAVVDLAPGDYQTRWEYYYDGELLGSATVTITVTHD